MTKQQLIFQVSDWTCTNDERNSVFSPFNNRSILFGKISAPISNLKLVELDLGENDIERKTRAIMIFFNQNNDEAKNKYETTKRKLNDTLSAPNNGYELKFYIERVDAGKTNEGIRFDNGEIHFNHDDFSDFEIQEIGVPEKEGGNKNKFILAVFLLIFFFLILIMYQYLNKKQTTSHFDKSQK